MYSGTCIGNVGSEANIVFLLYAADSDELR